MKAEVIQKALKRSPFVPFEVQTSAGQIYKIIHHDQASLSPQRRNLSIWEMETDGLDIMSVAHISALRTQESEGQSS